MCVCFMLWCFLAPAPCAFLAKFQCPFARDMRLDPCAPAPFTVHHIQLCALLQCCCRLCTSLGISTQQRTKESSRLKVAALLQIDRQTNKHIYRVSGQTTSKTKRRSRLYVRVCVCERAHGKEKAIAEDFSILSSLESNKHYIRCELYAY